jgi:hypothetical protein
MGRSEYFREANVVVRPFSELEVNLPHEPMEKDIHEFRKGMIELEH